MIENYYHTLGLSEDASPEQIKHAYRELAKKYHPDKHQGDVNFEEKFKRISAAYDILSDPEKKRNYDDRRAYYTYQSTYSPDTGPATTYYARPRTQESSIYDMRKREYTPLAWMFGRIVIFLIIMASLLIPYGIFYYSSVWNYEAGLKAEADGDYLHAISLYKRAISQWGGRNLEACLKAGDLYIRLGAHIESIRMLQEAYDYTNSDSVEQWLHFRTGMAQSYLGNQTMALAELDMVSDSSVYADSVYLLKAEIYTYRTREYDKGIKTYSSLIDREVHLKESYFGLGWCFQHLFQYPEAITAYSGCIREDPENINALFYRGSAYYYNKDSTRACSDFLRASELGSDLARRAYVQSCTDSLNSFVSPHESVN